LGAGTTYGHLAAAVSDALSPPQLPEWHQLMVYHPQQKHQLTCQGAQEDADIDLARSISEHAAALLAGHPSAARSVMRQHELNMMPQVQLCDALHVLPQACHAAT
jgi:hypothetical protein